jgi:hypothetical protein
MNQHEQRKFDDTIGYYFASLIICGIFAVLVSAVFWDHNALAGGLLTAILMHSFGFMIFSNIDYCSLDEKYNELCNKYNDISNKYESEKLKDEPKDTTKRATNRNSKQAND